MVAESERSESRTTESESDIAFHNVRRACQENFKTAEPTDRNPNDHRYH